jgi:CHAD domain-containing protein
MVTPAFATTTERTTERAHCPDAPSVVLRLSVRSLFRDLPKALAGDAEAIHQIRVAERRLRAALRLLARKPHGQRVRRVVRRLRRLVRAAGRSRDVDVTLARLREHVFSGRRELPEADVLLARLTAARRRSRAKMARDLGELDISRLQRDLRRVVTQGAAEDVRARLPEAKREGAQEVLAILGSCGRRFDPGRLHTLRCGCRRLRYVAEIVDRLRGQHSEAPERLRQIQDGLGRMHDDWVLSAWLEGEGRDAASRGRPALARTARTLAARFRAASRKSYRALSDDGMRARVQAALAAMRRSSLGV